MMSASCVVGVVNIDTRKAHKKPRNPAISKIERKKKLLANANIENESKKPLYGSEVSALDRRIGVCS